MNMMFPEAGCAVRNSSICQTFSHRICCCSKSDAVCLGEPAILSAQVLGIADKSVSRIKQRALSKLRNLLKGELFEDGF